ncbi:MULTISPECIES: hypothetical protein [Lysinibacillus]|uniref:hypothetical protein n=1 Tax=Lysinibacillus TaxID=400634 RepID=UPI00214AC7E3|nr:MULTISPECIES: hypothetical protein [Lysinibacillus]UUV25986.1 hypothetical protein NP781_05025 [Lysinibacillus sp. FN11]UYB48859.1 hypothetical protein OCI51_07815 [Lysinibacillus capsici]
MKILKAIKKYLFGEGFEVGETVYWENRYHPEFTGEYKALDQCVKLLQKVKDSYEAPSLIGTVLGYKVK